MPGDPPKNQEMMPGDSPKNKDRIILDSIVEVYDRAERLRLEERAVREVREAIASLGLNPADLEQDFLESLASLPGTSRDFFGHLQ